MTIEGFHDLSDNPKLGEYLAGKIIEKTFHSKYDNPEIEEHKKLSAELPAGQKVCWYDDMGFLCGSAGFIIMEGDKAIAYKSIWIS